jgi:hypothetical protein
MFSCISNKAKRRSVTSWKQEAYKSFYLTTYVVQWKAEVLCLKQITVF